MASLVVQNAGRFAAGETVSAYPESNWPPFRRPPAGAPVGSASGTGAMDADSATITGLAADTRYYVYGPTSERYVAMDTTDQASQQAVTNPTGPAGGDLTGTYPDPTLRATLSDPAAGTAGLRTLGSTGNKALPGTYLDTDAALAANSDVKVASQKAAKAYADTKQAALGFTAEDVANKDVDATLAANSDTKYASQKATKGYVDTASGLLVPKSAVDAKGDLLAGTADNTVARVAVGTDGQVLTADAASTPGLKWATPDVTQAELDAVLAAYEDLRTGAGLLAGASAAGPWLLGPAAAGVVTTANLGYAPFDFDPADHAIAGKTTKLRLVLAVVTNAVAPVANFTAGLYPVATYGGASGAYPTVATVGAVAGQSGAVTAPGAAARVTSVGADFTAPAADDYALGVLLSTTSAANSNCAVVVKLQIRHV